MKITVRPIKGESFFVEVPETDTIESLKHLADKQLQAATSSYKQLANVDMNQARKGIK